jgi:hypothetical protein
MQAVQDLVAHRFSQPSRKPSTQIPEVGERVPQHRGAETLYTVTIPTGTAKAYFDFRIVAVVVVQPYHVLHYNTDEVRDEL